MQFFKKNKKIIIILIAVVLLAGLVSIFFALKSFSAHKALAKVRPIAERLYDKERSYKNLCKSEEVANIVKNNCESEDKKWLVYRAVGLGRIWCADYQGRVEETKKVPETDSFVCK